MQRALRKQRRSLWSSSLMLSRYLQGEAMRKGTGKRMRAVVDAGLG